MVDEHPFLCWSLLLAQLFFSNIVLAGLLLQLACCLFYFNYVILYFPRKRKVLFLIEI